MSPFYRTGSARVGALSQVCAATSFERRRVRPRLLGPGGVVTAMVVTDLSTVGVPACPKSPDKGRASSRAWTADRDRIPSASRPAAAVWSRPIHTLRPTDALGVAAAAAGRRLGPTPLWHFVAGPPG